MAGSNSDQDTRPRALLRSRPQVHGKLIEIRAYIDEQRGNDPDDLTGWKVLQSIFHDLFYLRRWPWTGRQIAGMNRHYRQRRTGGNYLLYYYFDELENTLFLIDLRHGSQRPLKPNTIRKYKGEIPTD